MSCSLNKVHFAICTVIVLFLDSICGVDTSTLNDEKHSKMWLVIFNYYLNGGIFRQQPVCESVRFVWRGCAGAVKLVVRYTPKLLEEMEQRFDRQRTARRRQQSQWCSEQLPCYRQPTVITTLSERADVIFEPQVFCGSRCCYRKWPFLYSSGSNAVYSSLVTIPKP